MSAQAFSLQDKTILVNGMASGLGQVIAQACSQRGAKVLPAAQPRQPIHGLVHCVDHALECAVADLSEAELTRLFHSNVVQPVMLTQQLLQTDSLAPNASIVFLLSTAAHMGAKGQGAYAASKAALLGMIKCLALEQAAQGIRVNGVSPRADEAIWPDVANSVIFLLADASRWITGTSLLINGAGSDSASRSQMETGAAA
ncbi:SDR family oxidoreductase [Methylobacillus caricis]|uniref:SDR family NAD(P)-dependent oxidoreductase n=1 Tax=Methylobacillus caricis TaxID=1971611 RepID=UPI001CFFBBEB|nr:SDR family oxidoreductase [Methylobacillus caricis]MCB5188958.1 SDR family oxidoreductase [Methylobacillus caricis]